MVGNIRGSSRGDLGEDGTVEDTGYEVIGVFLLQSNGVVARAKANESEEDSTRKPTPCDSLLQGK